ncbi:MAG: 4a-hydroxytetrahydrobiopterin dehydratase [Neomegalonema sp.]|nr:4a-hydroxytetrahydrobiopterin dehydratase [Neomegalonema sp.]
MPQCLSQSERQTELAALLEAGWAMAPGRDAIVKEFHFQNFNQAYGWMTRVALIAESLDHHPEWTNIYNRVSVVLSTHDAGGLTRLDLTLAQRIDAL